MGELITLMRHLDPTETEFFLEGEGEVQEKLAELGIKTDGEIAPAPAEPAPAPTVGDLSLTQPTSGAQPPPTNVSRATFVRAAAFSRKESLMDYARSRIGRPFGRPVEPHRRNRYRHRRRAQLTCRRFLKVFGPLGAGVTTVAVDGVNKEEVLEDGIGRIVGRTQLELPLFYEDFTLLSRDMEYAAQTGYPLDLSVAIAAAKKASRREDDLILNGSKALGTDGLLTVKGSSKIKKSDWSQGANSFADITAGVAQLAKTGYLGRYALVVSPRPVPRLAAPAAEHRSAGDRPHQEAHRRQRVHDQRHRVPARPCSCAPSPSTWILPSAWICRLATWSSRTSTTRSVSWKQPPSGVKDPAAIVVFA